MYCGSCLRDNAVAGAIRRLGHDLILMPLYTPLRVDRRDESSTPVFYGGINVYLEQKLPIFRKLPRAITRLFDSSAILNLSSKLSGMTQASELGELTISILKGDEGNQKRELDRLCDWLASDFKPEIVNLPNSMFVGTAREIKRRTGAKVVCSLTGEDLFLEGLVEPHKSEALKILRERAADADHFVATSKYYADFMADYLRVERARISVVPLGIAAEEYARQTSRPTDPFTVGYLARIAPEKGFHILCEAFRILRTLPGAENSRLLAAGWLGAQDRPYFEENTRRIQEWGLGDAFEYRGEVTFKEKIHFLDEISVLSVPTVYRDPKGLFILEALAHGVPVVQPAHGAFPEMIEATGGGLLFEPLNPNDLAEKLHTLMRDREQADRLALHGQMVVRQRFTDAAMARQTIEVYERLTG